MMHRFVSNLLAIMIFVLACAPMAAEAICWRHHKSSCRWCARHAASAATQSSPSAQSSPGAKSTSNSQQSGVYADLGDVQSFISPGDLATGLELARFGQTLLQRIRQIRAERIRNQNNGNRPAPGPNPNTGVDHSAQLDRIEKLLNARLSENERNTDTNTSSITALGNRVESRLLAIEEKLSQNSDGLRELEDSLPEEIGKVLLAEETIEILVKKLAEALKKDNN